MAPFREDEDIEHYLTMFERIAMATKFEIDSETYRQRFRSKQVLEGETPRELQARLRDLFQKWPCPQERSTEEVAELIILEQFLWMVNPEIRTWIKEHNPQRGRRGLQLGDFSSRREQRWTNVDFSSRREQEDSRDSGHAATSKSGGGTGSVFRRSRYTKDRPAAHTTPRARVVCHKCGQPGDISPECPIGPPTASNLCHSPKPHTSHHSRPDRTGVTVPVGLRGRTWVGLVDSGSSQTFVQRRCLGAQDVTAMGKVKVRCIHGDIREYDTVEVTLEIDGQAYVLNVGVMDESPYPVVIGQDVPVLAELLQCRDMSATAYVTTRAQTKS
ncbi:hypothetical protein ACEWY4_010321 [Coilia grayii]|uniref:CCHC-type domain-containing protein n=1 Tax=Coilia grayii TaxID=363190 RepID=A0ABD1K1K4_9TELE